MATAVPIWSPKMTLHNGINMPSIGMGTFRIRNPDVLMMVVDEALNNGYRMFDTAAVYGNEGHLKKAFDVLLPKYGLEREEIFVITKLAPADHGSGESVRKAYEKSLENLGLDYIDLYLIHFPGTNKIPAQDERNARFRDASWAALTQLYDDGRVNAIGVSNYTLRHIRELMANNHGAVPAVNQVEFHPYFSQSKLLSFCKQNDIALQAYCSFGGTSVSNYNLITDPVVVKIAKKLDVTAAQVLLVWALQKDVSVIPKSTNPAHIANNISLGFRISDDDMKLLDGLSEVNIKYAWDSSMVY